MTRTRPRWTADEAGRAQGCARPLAIGLCFILGLVGASCAPTPVTAPGGPIVLGAWHAEGLPEGPNDATLAQLVRRTLGADEGLRWSATQDAKLASAGFALARRQDLGGLAEGGVGHFAPYCLLVRLRLPHAGARQEPGRRSQRLVGIAPLSQVTAAAVGDALRSAWRQVAHKRALFESGEAGWLAAIEPNQLRNTTEPANWAALVDADYRAQAMTFLAEARARSSTPPLLAALAEGDGAPVDSAAHLLGRRAIGALAVLGDQRAVLPLIAYSQRKSVQQVAQVATAVGLIGGRVAEGWLTTLATGHEDDQVRSAARLALAELPAPTSLAPAAGARHANR